MSLLPRKRLRRRIGHDSRTVSVFILEAAKYVVTCLLSRSTQHVLCCNVDNTECDTEQETGPVAQYTHCIGKTVWP